MSDNPKIRVLVVNDEYPIRKLLHRGSSGYGYDVETGDSGRDGLEIAARQPPDILLLDINLNSRPDGLEVCQEPRQWSAVPVIMLTVRDGKQIKLAALNAGADDYITKPFDMEELEARIRAVMRRTAYEGAHSVSGEVRVHDLVVDLVRRRVTLADEEIHLTPKEYELLKWLVTNPGKVLTFSVLLEKVSGESGGARGVRSEHNVRVYVNTLRKKLKDDLASTSRPRFIFNEPGIGYRFADIWTFARCFRNTRICT